MEKPENKNNDYVWWSISAVAGALFWSFPAIIQSGEKDGGPGLLMAGVALLLCGIVFGYLEPQRFWRWALASILPLPIIEIISQILNPGIVTGSTALLHSLPYLIIKIPVYVLQGLPVLIGAAMGAAIQHSGDQDFKIRISNDQKIWLLGLLLGSICCLIYILATIFHTSAVPIGMYKFSILLLIIVSAGISFIAPQKVYRWAFAIGTGVVALVVFRIIVDLIADAGSHNLFPIEIFFAVIISYPITFLGAYSGLFLKKVRSRKLKIVLTAAFTLGIVALLLGPSLMKLSREASVRQKSNEFIFKVRHNSRGTSVRGNNLWLNFEANRFKIADKSAWDNNQSVFVSFDRDSLGYAMIRDVTKVQPVSSKFWVKTMAILNPKDPDFLRLNYPFSNYLLGKKYAKDAKRDLQNIMKDSLSFITLKVYINENNFVVSDLNVDGQEFSDFMKSLGQK